MVRKLRMILMIYENDSHCKIFVKVATVNTTRRGSRWKARMRNVGLKVTNAAPQDPRLLENAREKHMTARPSTGS